MTNEHGVSAIVWKRWSEDQRELFRDLYQRMIESPWAFAHPEAAEVPEEHWKTTAWNAAFLAADMSRSDITWVGKGVVYTT